MTYSSDIDKSSENIVKETMEIYKSIIEYWLIQKMATD
jgi:hypothetical protein